MIVRAGMTKPVIRYVIRYGIGFILTLMMLYLYLIFISVYRDAYGNEIRAEATVQEIRIAGPVLSEWRRWVVVFRVTKLLKGRLDTPKIVIQVHSPSLDLGVSKVGQSVLLHRRDSSWTAQGATLP